MTFLGPNTVPILVAAAATITVLGAGGALTEVGVWYASLRKPSWQPPSWAFAPAWSLIGVFTAWAGVVAWTNARSDTARTEVIALFLVNALLNVGWSLLFFKLHRPDWAYFESVALWLSVAALTAGLASISASAGWLMLPYLLWVAFATVLNRVVVQLNQPFRTFAGSQIKRASRSET